MAAGNYDFTIEQGVDKNLTLTFFEDDGVTPIDLTGIDFRMQLRLTVKSLGVLDDLTVSNGRINDTDAATGVIVIVFPSSKTTVYNFDTCVYDLESVNGSLVSREMEGEITLSREVTR